MKVLLFNIDPSEVSASDKEQFAQKFGDDLEYVRVQVTTEQELDDPSPHPATATGTASAPRATSAAASAPASTPGAPASTSAAQDGAAAGQVLALINQARSAAGLPALTVTSGLEASSSAHNLKMAGGCGLSHQCPGEPAIGDRELDRATACLDARAGGPLCRFSRRR